MELVKPVVLKPRSAREIRSWGQVAGSLISFVTIATAFGGLWTSLQEFYASPAQTSTLSSSSFHLSGVEPLCEDLFRRR